jgi:hypothetical protein
MILTVEPGIYLIGVVTEDAGLLRFTCLRRCGSHQEAALLVRPGQRIFGPEQVSEVILHHMQAGDVLQLSSVKRREAVHAWKRIAAVKG